MTIIKYKNNVKGYMTALQKKYKHETRKTKQNLKLLTELEEEIKAVKQLLPLGNMGNMQII